jgi:hypothetical protein
LMRIVAIVLVSALTLLPVGVRAQRVPVTLHEIYLEDQNDMPTKTPRVDPSAEQIKAFDDRAAARRVKLHAMLDRGEITTGSDLYEAAYVFQHGETAADFLLAHILAVDAVAKGFDRARWLSVATLDRYLQLIGQPQVFGTQFPFDPKLPHPITNGGRFSGRTQAPFDERFLPAYLRPEFCVPDLEQQKKNLATLNSGSYPKMMTLPNCAR